MLPLEQPLTLLFFLLQLQLLVLLPCYGCPHAAAAFVVAVAVNNVAIAAVLLLSLM